jgi:hypothetical protein
MQRNCIKEMFSRLRFYEARIRSAAIVEDIGVGNSMMAR